MVKSIRSIILILFWIITEFTGFSQYYVKFRGDSLKIQKDSVILSVETKTMDIVWQVSRDSITWQSLDQTNDSLFIRIDSCAYYRAVLSDGSCYPVKSDVALVAFKTINVTGNTLHLDPIGGVYVLPSGIKLIVPPEAIDDIDFTVDLLDSIQSDLKIPLDVYTGRSYCTGIYCNPAVIHFQKPVRIILPAPEYRSTDLPCIYFYNYDFKLWDQHFGALFCSEERHTIEFSTEDIYPTRVELIHDAFGKAEILEGKNDIDDRICQRSLVQIISKSHDYMGTLANGTCSATTNSVEATFANCKNRPVSNDFLQEISDKCSPTCTAFLTDDCFYTIGSQATMTFKMQVGGLALEKNTIVVELPSGIVGVVEDNNCSTCTLRTDADGEASLTIKSIDLNVAGTINWWAAAEYYLRIQSLSGPEGAETNKEFLKTVELSGTKKIVACPKIRLSFSCNRNLPNYPYKVLQNEEYIFYPKCYDQQGNEIPCPGEVEFFVDKTYPASKEVVKIDKQKNTLTTTGGGIAYVKARIKGSDIIGGQQIFNVAFQYIMPISIIDWDNKRCYCDFNPDPTAREWFLMSYLGTLTFKLWLNMVFTEENNVASLKVVHKVGYTSTSTFCKDTTWKDPEELYSEWKEGVYNIRAHTIDPYGVCTTQKLLDGTEFELAFLDLMPWDPVHIPTFICKLSSSGEIEITMDRYYPEYCLGNIRSTGLLH